MKNVLCSLLALGIVVAQLIFGSGCSAAGSETKPGQLAFAPDSPEAWELFDRVADRIEAAAGVRPYAALAGTPFTVGPQRPGNTSCADTVVRYTDTEVLGVRVDIYNDQPRCFEDLTATGVHEVIHAIRAAVGMNLVDPNAGHSTGGLFQAEALDHRIDETTLDAICEAVNCNTYNPEK